MWRRGPASRCVDRLVGAEMPVPVVLVAGFLGAGKTTVVNHLLAHAEGDIALIGTDGRLNIAHDSGVDDADLGGEGCSAGSEEGNRLGGNSVRVRK